MEGDLKAKSFSWDFLDKVTTQGLSVIISIILARMIAPDQYGIVALATVFTQILDAFVNPGFTSALIQKRSPEKADYSTVFWSNTVVSILLYLIIFFAAPFIESFYQVKNLSHIIRVLAIHLPFAGVNSIVVAYVRKNTMYKRYFFVSLLGTLFSGGIALFVAYQGLGVWALVLYSIGNCALDTLFSLLFISWKPSFEFSKQRFRSLFSFGGKLLQVKLIDLIYTQISPLIIGKKYSTTELSHYKKGEAYPNALINSFSSSLSDVLFPAFSNIQDQPQALASALAKGCKICDFVIYPIAIGLFACANSFIEVLLTAKWLPCVPYLRIWCLYYLCTPSSGIMYQAIKALGKGRLLLKLELVKKSYSLLLIVLSVLFFDSPLAITAAFLFAGLISLVINLFMISHNTCYRIQDYIKGLFPIIAITACMGFAVFSFEFLNWSPFLTLFVQVITGIIIYVGLAKLFQFEQFEFFFSLVKRKKAREK